MKFLQVEDLSKIDTNDVGIPQKNDHVVVLVSTNKIFSGRILVSDGKSYPGTKGKKFIYYTQDRFAIWLSECEEVWWVMDL